jgi:hypothetical protein
LFNVQHCPICTENDEDDWHVFFGCRNNRRIWNEAGQGAVIEGRIQTAASVTEVLFDICKVEEDHVAGLVAVVAFTLCNVDASFYKHAAHTGWGLCIHNSQGQFMAAGCNWIREKLTTIEGEATSLLEAIQAKQSGVSEISSIISTIAMLNFHSNFKVKFIKRQANLAAHTLPRVAKSWTSRTLFDSIHYCFANIVINEMS